jgi:hypothetical protein
MSEPDPEPRLDRLEFPTCHSRRSRHIVPPCAQRSSEGQASFRLGIPRNVAVFLDVAVN